MHGLRKLYKLLISRHHRILANDTWRRPLPESETM